jgi:hypothetical protein
MADATCFDCDEYFAGAGPTELELGDQERSVALGDGCLNLHP